MFRNKQRLESSNDEIAMAPAVETVEVVAADEAAHQHRATVTEAEKWRRAYAIKRWVEAISEIAN
jgi:hypothetical protein